MKICPKCSTSKPLDLFARDAKSKDGRTRSCKLCISALMRHRYWNRPNERATNIARACKNQKRRFDEDPARKRSHRLWNHAKSRGALIPKWVRIADFDAVCRRALRKGPEYVLDHVVPLKHPLVCGLHVPWNLRVVLKATNWRKGNSFDPATHRHVLSSNVDRS